MDARSEGAAESGILYARKQLQAEITQTLLIKSLEQHWNDKGEAYLLTAKQLYSGIYREFYSRETNEIIPLNVPQITLSGEVIDNDISTLPRMKVIVDQSPAGVTHRAIDRSINTELLRVVGPENPLSRAKMVANVMKTLDHSKSEQKELEEASNLEYEFAKENLMTQLLGLKSQQLQLSMQMQQMNQPQMPMGAQAGGEQESPQENQGEMQEEQLQGQPQAEVPSAPANGTMQANNEQAANL
jgi:hypothetical protein